MIDLHQLDEHRITDIGVLDRYGWTGDGTCGAFQMSSPVDGAPLLIVASSNGGWDHVSVSRQRRTPTWGEMDFIKRKFFEADAVVVQYHVAIDDHINVHPNCLHLWRCHAAFPLPPKEMV